MAEELRDPDVMTGIVRGRVLRAMVPALGKLGRVARGRDKFKDDHELRACVALARLAPVLIRSKQVKPRGIPRPHPSHTPERARELLIQLRALQCRSDEEVARDQELENERRLNERLHGRLLESAKEES